MNEETTEDCLMIRVRNDQVERKQCSGRYLREVGHTGAHLTNTIQTWL